MVRFSDDGSYCVIGDASPLQSLLQHNVVFLLRRCTSELERYSDFQVKVCFQTVKGGWTARHRTSSLLDAGGRQFLKHGINHQFTGTESDLLCCVFFLLFNRVDETLGFAVCPSEFRPSQKAVNSFCAAHCSFMRGVLKWQGVRPGPFRFSFTPPDC